MWEQCKHRQLEFETLAKAVVEARKRRDMKKKLAKLKADLKDQSQRNAMRRVSIVDTEAQKREELAKEEEVHAKVTAALGKAMAETEMAHQEELEHERQRAKEKYEAEMERIRHQAEIQLAEKMEQAAVAAKAKEVKMELDMAEAHRQNSELNEFKQEAEYLREELRKYKTECAVLRGILQQVTQNTQKPIALPAALLNVFPTTS